jgi:hypothetical protein
MSANSKGNPANLAANETDLGQDLVWGVAAIGREIKRTPRQTYHLLETGKLPARKFGGRWVSTTSRLKKFFSAVIDGEAV